MMDTNKRSRLRPSSGTRCCCPPLNSFRSSPRARFPDRPMIRVDKLEHPHMPPPKHHHTALKHGTLPSNHHLTTLPAITRTLLQGPGGAEKFQGIRRTTITPAHLQQPQRYGTLLAVRGVMGTNFPAVSTGDGEMHVLREKWQNVSSGVQRLAHAVAMCASRYRCRTTH